MRLARFVLLLPLVLVAGGCGGSTATETETTLPTVGQKTEVRVYWHQKLPRSAKCKIRTRRSSSTYAELVCDV